MNFQRILAVGAHPDDVEYACLGFLIKHIAADQHIYVGSLGSRFNGSAGVERISETTSALASLQCKSFTIREKFGIDPSEFNEIFVELEELIDVKNPDLILVHSPNDSHQEHNLLYQITIAAARRKPLSILRYGVVSNTSKFSPDYFLQIDEDVLDKKIQSLSYHISQADKFYMDPVFIRYVHHRPYAALHDFEYCEAYEIERIMY